LAILETLPLDKAYKSNARLVATPTPVPTIPLSVSCSAVSPIAPEAAPVPANIFLALAPFAISPPGAANSPIVSAYSPAVVLVIS